MLLYIPLCHECPSSVMGATSVLLPLRPLLRPCRFCVENELRSRYAARLLKDANGEDESEASVVMENALSLEKAESQFGSATTIDSGRT